MAEPLRGTRPTTRSAVRRSRLAAAFLAASLVLLALAPDGRAEIIDFEGDAPGDSFLSRDYGSFRITALVGQPAQVDPGSSTCALPGLCPSNGTNVLLGFGAITIEAIDGSPFRAKSLHVGAPIPIPANLSFVVAPADGSPPYTTTDAPSPPAGTFQLHPLAWADFGELSSLTIIAGTQLDAIDRLDLEILDSWPMPPPRSDPVVGEPGTLALLSDDRSVRASSVSCWWNGDVLECDPFEDGEAVPSPAFSDFDVTYSFGNGGASHTSTVATSGFEGSLGAHGLISDSSGSGSSTFEITFSVDDWTYAQLIRQDWGWDPFFSLTRDGAPVPVDCRLDCDLGQYVLEPGTYTFHLRTEALDYFSNTTFTFEAAPVGVVEPPPVPAHSPLGLGLLALLLAGSATRMRGRGHG